MSLLETKATITINSLTVLKHTLSKRREPGENVYFLDHD